MPISHAFQFVAPLPFLCYPNHKERDSPMHPCLTPMFVDRRSVLGGTRGCFKKVQILQVWGPGVCSLRLHICARN